MKKIIRKVLEELGDTQINLGSEAARETIATLVSVALKDKGVYKKYISDELEEQKARETWVCSICGENTYDVDYEHIGSCTNHLGCELEVEMGEKNGDDVAKALGHMDEDGEFITEGRQEQIKSRGVIKPPKKRVKKKFDEV
jgi:hypothetical protein|tara:strand:+ start:715 stop:1140 length:426 start_codon:yes stop_codon:yes gene_type:complete